METVNNDIPLLLVYEEAHKYVPNNDLAKYRASKESIERIAKEPMFGMSLEDLQKVLDPKKYVGRAPQQTEEYINEVVKPVIEANKDGLIDNAELSV